MITMTRIDVKMLNSKELKSQKNMITQKITLYQISLKTQRDTSLTLMMRIMNRGN